MSRSPYPYVLLACLMPALPALCRADDEQDAAAPEAAVTNAVQETAVVPDARAKAEEPQKSFRDPFWPVGYVPPDPDAVKESVTLTEAPERWPKLELQGVSLTPSGYVALLKNIGLVSQGETLRLKSGKRIYTYKINAVTKNGISAQKVSSKLIEANKPGKTPAKGAPGASR